MSGLRCHRSDERAVRELVRSPRHLNERSVQEKYALVIRPHSTRCPPKESEPTLPNSESQSAERAVPDKKRLYRLPAFAGKYGGGGRLFFTEHHVRSLLSKLFTSTTPRQVGVLSNALNAVGYTPLIRLDKIAKDTGAKCNFRTPRISGSRPSGALGHLS